MDIKLLISFLTLIPFALCSWSRWSRWSTCSRSCDGGISNRTRDCLGDSLCEGESVRYRVCHLRACAAGIPDARQEQCSSYNTHPYQGHLYDWITDKDNSNPCVLRCKAQGQDLSVVLAPTVVDGTRCTRHSKAMCINGVCVPVGCDNVVGSEKRRDTCGVCGGDGSTCQEPPHNTLDRNSAERDQIMPLRSKTEDENNLPSHLTVSHADEIVEHRLVENMNQRDEEVVENNFDYQNDGGSVASLFGDAIPLHIWQETPFSSCSATCGEGVQKTTIVCISIRNRKRVDNSLCANSVKPIHRERVCDTNVPCRENARWSTGVWGECSATCGGGYSDRPVYCARYLDTGEIVEADEELCTGSIPEARKRCNEFTCPTWHTGQWSPCSVSCGAGEQFRAVVCKRLTTEASCNEDDKPGETQVCHTGVICVGNHGRERLPEHDNRVIIDNKPIKVVASHNDYKEYRHNNAQDFSEFRDNPNIEWRNYNYRDYGDNYNNLEFDYRDYGYRDFEYNGNDIVDKMGIGRDYDYRGNDMMASHGGSGETPEIHLDEFRPQEPSFVASAWGACSVTCGHGVRKRSVKCRVFISYTNTFQELPESRCTDPKPVGTEECILPNCPILLQEQHRESYAWQFAGYQACSATCGGGFRDPLFYCVRQDPTRHIQTDEKFCSRFPRPSGVLKQSCNDFDCPASLSRNDRRWKIYPFGECSNPCGGGTKHRPVACVLDTGADGQIQRVPDQMCADSGLAIPARTHTCNNVSCPPEWVEGEWSQCTSTCGRGMRNRQVSCKQVVPPLRQVRILADQFCQGTKPQSLITCESEIQCLRNVQMNSDPSYYVQLQTGDKTIRLVAGGTAVLLPGKVLRVRCPVTNFARSNVLWYKEGEPIGRKGRVKKTDRGMLTIRGFERRDEGVYTCQALDESTSITLIMHSENEALEKYLAREDERDQRFFQKFRQKTRQDRNHKEEFTEPYIFEYFETHELPFHFVQSKWQACSQSCGGAGIQSRVVTCELNFDRYYLKVEDRYCYEKGEDKPLTTQDCGFEQCPVWEEGQWGECSDEVCMGPGTGAYVRPLHCMAPDGSSLPHRQCDQTRVPQDKRSCQKETCTPKWIESDWTECSRTCGGEGYQTRSLLCVWAPNNKPANGQCEGLIKPDVIRTCAMPACPNRNECRDESTYCSLVEMMNLCRYQEYRTKCCASCTLLMTRYRFRH